MYGRGAREDAINVSTLTLYNEPYLQPAEPDELDVDGLLRGLYRYRPAPEGAPTVAHPGLGRGAAGGAAGRDMLAEDWGVRAPRCGR